MDTQTNHIINIRQAKSYEALERNLDVRSNGNITKEVEIKSLRKLGLTELRIKSVLCFYFINPTMKLGSVSKCLNLLIEKLTEYGKTKEEILEFINNGSNTPIYQNIYGNLKLRMDLFEQANVLDTVLIYRGSLLGCSNYNRENCSRIKQYLESKNYNVSPEEIKSELFYDNMGIIRVKQKVKTLKNNI